GFEVRRSPITADQIEAHRTELRASGEADDDYLAILMSNDMRLTLDCKDDLEIAAARTVIGALAVLSGGRACDPPLDVTGHARYLEDRSSQGPFILFGRRLRERLERGGMIEREEQSSKADLVDGLAEALVRLSNSRTPGRARGEWLLAHDQV